MLLVLMRIPSQTCDYVFASLLGEDVDIIGMSQKLPVFLADYTFRNHTINSH